MDVVEGELGGDGKAIVGLLARVLSPGGDSSGGEGRDGDRSKFLPKQAIV